ncbi:MAG: hypothetical protein L3J98_10655 [Gammaproteobacteria bacterium]|nr:hypothetical protein [Gammaproteobacteria bacterium]MCF6260598.1 hypothetical protein [Gammaproteobacteria bacterium]
MQESIQHLPPKPCSPDRIDGLLIAHLCGYDDTAQPLVVPGVFGTMPADEQNQPQTHDEYWGEPNEPGLKYATDIAVLDYACALDLKFVNKLDINIMVSDR